MIEGKDKICWKGRKCEIISCGWNVKGMCNVDEKESEEDYSYNNLLNRKKGKLVDEDGFEFEEW
jgi:hypothetical protein